MAALTTLNITEKNANNSLSVTAKVNVTKEGVFTTTLSKEDVDKIHFLWDQITYKQIRQ